MNLDIANVDFGVNEWDVTKAIAQVLHNEDEFLRVNSSARLLNFKVKLNPRNVGVQNDGTGVLTLPSHEVGNLFLRWLKKDQKNKIQIGKKKIWFHHSESKPHRALAATLDKTPYVDPDIEAERQKKIRQLDVRLRVDKVQVGLFYRPQQGANRNFSIEWEASYTNKSIGWLFWEYEHKLIRIQIGDRMTEQTGSSIVIKFANIRKLGVNYDFGNPFLCFDLVTPPILEEEDFNRQLKGDEKEDSKKFRRRVGFLHPGHARVAPYAHHLRIVLYQTEDLDNFDRLCEIAELRRPIRAKIDAFKHGFCSLQRLHKVQVWLKELDWRVAFQLEAMLRNALLNTEDLLVELYKPINKLYEENRVVASEVLRFFTDALQTRPPGESPLQCFQRTCARKISTTPTRLPPGMFNCHHVCFAPTRMILEGPFVIQSNRVIREWDGYQDNFIRVDFRDEDKLQYRWDREVDGKPFLEGRVGSTLKNGFELAGREFEFLAYSSSSLREHAVWFLHPFHHPERGFVNADYIRRGLGFFDQIIHQPSRYAARIAQAFTATDPSVKIPREYVEEIDDIGEKPYLFTDGVGTISRQLGTMIWKELCKVRRDGGKGAVEPSAYQIRFLGCKGMVAIDDELSGIKMCIRPSMKKFEGPKGDFAEIEIARAFESPNYSHLNRPMVMVLEDRGVKMQSFMSLQNKAVAESRTIHDSLIRFREVLMSHSLGSSYRLSFIIERLNRIGLEIGQSATDPETRLDNPFLGRVRHFAMTHVLRDIKHSARIKVPKSYLLVGVADEGPTYVGKEGYEDVCILQEGKIFACVQEKPEDEPKFLKGSCTISRNPVVHPGDIQRVFAIGEPPKDKRYLFKNLKNCVVLPSTGARSLASCLGGGDLDGDLYDIIFHSPLLPTEEVKPAEYLPGQIRETQGKRPSAVEDICDFIVEYLRSDILGLLSDKHLTIADQSKFGTQDAYCLKLADLCSQAVDYPKNGIPVDIECVPRFLIPYKPDWHAAEVAAPRRTDYYESDRALGHLYRAIEIEDPATFYTEKITFFPLSDPISVALKLRLQEHLPNYTDPDGNSREIIRLFQFYVDELSYICATHTLTSASDVRLHEEEVVVGTILAKCSQRRLRKDRMHRVRTHSGAIVREIQRELVEDNLERASDNVIQAGLAKAWTAWDFSLRRSTTFGANSFGLIALGIIFDCLDELDNRAKKSALPVGATK